MTIVEVNSVDELEPQRDPWRRLLDVTPQANFFQSLEWLEIYWRHFGSTQRLRVLLQLRRGELVGVVPLVVRKERTKIGSLRFATYPLDYWGSFYGPVSARPDEALAEAVDYLQSSKRDWDVFEPRWIGATANDADNVESVLKTQGLAPVRSSFDATSVVELPNTCEEYLATRKGSWRYNRRRWRHRLEQAGELSHLRYRPGGEQENDADPRWDLYQQCLRIAEASWQGSSATGTTLTHPTVAEFLRDVHQAAARSGGLDLNLLYLDDCPIAFAYNYHYKGNVFSLRVGYDPNGNPGGAGNVLYAMAIDDSIRRGDWRYDLGPSHLQCKRPLATGVLPLYRMSCFRSASLRQQLLHWKRSRDAQDDSIVDAAAVAHG